MVKDQKVEFVFDTWKYHFGWKTFGGGFIRYILLINNYCIVEIEVPEISNTPGYSSSGFTRIQNELDIFFNLCLFPIEKILDDPYLKTRDDLKNFIVSLKLNPTVKNIFDAISNLYSKKEEKIELKSIYFRKNIEDLNLRKKGNEVRLSFYINNQKQIYLSNYKSEEEAGKNFLTLKNLFGIYDKIDLKVSNKDYAKEAWYVEILGNSFIGSINYDYKFQRNFSLRVGVSYLIFGFGFPIMLNFLSGDISPHHLELGGGFVPMIGGIDGEKLVMFETFTIGYRYQSKNGGLVFKISFTPLLNIPDPGNILPWGGIAIGYCFN